MIGREREPNSEEWHGLAEILAGTFIQRRDLYAKQLDNGSYVNIRKPLRRQHLILHLRGELTLGVYVLDENSRGRYLVLDADAEPDWRRLQALASVLAEMGAPSYLEHSRRGGHLWMFFAESLPCGEIRRFARGLMGHFGIEDIETFPIQDSLTTGPGSLIRLPFGVHLKSGRRYGFYRPDGTPLAGSIREQIQALKALQMISRGVFEQFMAYVPQKTPRAPYNTPGAVREAFNVPVYTRLMSERIKDVITVRQFVLRYVELSPKGTGLCPFHDDHHPSFAVNDEKGNWKCFAGCGGGSVIDFYMMYQKQVMGRECDFKTAVGELSEILV